MYGRKLTDTEVATRMVELRNLRKLHAAARQREILKDARIRELEAALATQQATIDTLKIQMVELQTMVFGKKKKPPTGTVVPVLQVPTVVPRTKASYRRQLPPASAITTEVAVPLPQSCACGGAFRTVTTHERFEEDIPLPELTPDYYAKLVTHYTIERGVCRACGRATSGKELGGAEVSLGSNVRLLATHLVSVVGLSYAQVANLLLSLYGLQVSDGEIAKLLQKQHQTWLPAYHQLQTDIRAAPIRHYDETPWAIQDQGNYGHAWVMSASGSPQTLFHLATSRGLPHAQKLHGKANQNQSGVHITDDYQAYRNLPGQQQLCWVHLYRVIRDLRYNASLPKEQRSYVTQWYEGFAAIYQDLRQYLDEPYDEVVRATQATELWQRVRALATRPAPQAGEPDKLRKLKAQLLRAGQDKLLVCLPKDTPCDNNRAERDLRQLVLKRKRSFGSKTKNGARALSTVLSLCTTTWRSNPTGYFGALASLAE